MASQEQPDADPQRQAWREARRHISRYEEKQRELEFDLRREEDHLKAAQEEQAQLKCALEAMQQKKEQHGKKCGELSEELLELHKASRRLSEDASQSAQQLALVQGELAKSKAQLQQEREEMEHHLSEQQEISQKFREFNELRGPLQS